MTWYTGGTEQEGLTLVIEHGDFRISPKYGSDEGFQVTERGRVTEGLEEYKYTVRHYGVSNILEFTITSKRLDDPTTILDIVDWDFVMKKFRDSFDKDLSKITASRMQLS